MIIIYILLITRLSLNSANVSTMIPNTMFRPMRVTIMKKVKSKKTDLKAASPKFVDKGVVYIIHEYDRLVYTYKNT